MQENTNTPPKVYAPTDKDYVEIIKSDIVADPHYIQEEGVPAKIVYYCRNCKSMVSPNRIGKKLSFKCSVCDKDISFGTENSIQNYYNSKQKQNRD